MAWLVALAYVASAIAAAWLGAILDRRVDADASSCISGKPSTAVGLWMAFLQVLSVPVAVIWLLTPPAKAAADPYACFGAARYVAMAESFSCTDLPAFCAGARAMLAEAGSRPAAEKLARERGHSRMAIMLAKHFCR
ncbi:hypothetical protein [Bradyrhizobium sp. CCBAU 11434]|uniref:hypothetical protein n=1 Tax=Bradyrhizobium sp. CCBAU 11434 TaxID=1630885 RepID=UPI002305EF77|nr:hypothetical protein [Bradyrhizobium sp. CCBAU 11434]